MFRLCSSLEYVKVPNGTLYKLPLFSSETPNLVAVEGRIDMSNVTSSIYDFGSYNTKLRKITFENLGTDSAGNYINFKFDWGVEDPDNPLTQGARQSLIDSLITYSFDRAAAGYKA